MGCEAVEFGRYKRFGEIICDHVQGRRTCNCACAPVGREVAQLFEALCYKCLCSLKQVDSEFESHSRQDICVYSVLMFSYVGSVLTSD
jgi:hypothetical protein